MAEGEIKVAVDDYPTVSTNPTRPSAYEPPPSYAGAPSTSPPAYTTDSPPEYDSIFGKVRKVKDESDGNVDFGCKMIGLLCCNTVIVIIVIALTFAIPIASIVIGAMNLNDCRAEKYIPIYLVVAGVFGVVKACVDSGVKIREKKQRDDGDANEEDQNKRPNPVSSIINCFLIAWFIAGSVWVYRLWGKVQHDIPGEDDYCDKTTYLFAFAIITMVYALMALGLVCCCCVCALICCCMGKDD